MRSLIKKLQSRFEQRGDTLIEVMISIVILGLVLTGAYALSTHSLGNGVDAQNRNKALSIAQSQIEFLVNAQTNHTGGLSDFLGAYYHNAQAFCISSTNQVQAASANGFCPDGSFKKKITYNDHTNTFTIVTQWSKTSSQNPNQVTLYYRQPLAYTPPNDQCENIDGIQYTVPQGYSQVGRQCTPNNGGGGGGGGEVVVAGGGGPPICQITGYASDNTANGYCTDSQHSNDFSANQTSVENPPGSDCWQVSTWACNDDGCGTTTGTHPGHPGACTGDETLNPVIPGGTDGCGAGQVGEAGQCNPFVPGANVCESQTTAGSTNPNATPEQQCQSYAQIAITSSQDNTSSDGTSCVPSPINNFCYDSTGNGGGGSGGGGSTSCSNGATNPPDCNNGGGGTSSGPPPCDAGFEWNGATCTHNGSCGPCGCSLAPKLSRPTFGVFHLFVPTKYFACWSL